MFICFWVSRICRMPTHRGSVDLAATGRHEKTSPRGTSRDWHDIKKHHSERPLETGKTWKNITQRDLSRLALDSQKNKQKCQLKINLFRFSAVMQQMHMQKYIISRTEAKVSSWVRYKWWYYRWTKCKLAIKLNSYSIAVMSVKL